MILRTTMLRRRMMRMGIEEGDMMLEGVESSIKVWYAQD